MISSIPLDLSHDISKEMRGDWEVLVNASNALLNERKKRKRGRENGKGERFVFKRCEIELFKNEDTFLSRKHDRPYVSDIVPKSK